jgi:hypothetical protein
LFHLLPTDGRLYLPGVAMLASHWLLLPWSLHNGCDVRLHANVSCCVEWWIANVRLSWRSKCSVLKLKVKSNDKKEGGLVLYKV